MVPHITTPETVIGAVVGSGTEPGSLTRLFGSAFLVAPKVLMTARHVLDNLIAHVGETGHAGVVFGSIDDGGALVWMPHLIFAPYLHPTLDVAVAMVPSVPHENHLDIDRLNLYPPNQDVVSVEYSDSYWEPDGNGLTPLYLVAATRKGNLTTRPYVRTQSLRHPTEFLRLSFPALKGASGAPVFWHSRNNGDVVGMIVGNREQELLPVHLETVTGDGGEPLEERRYLLPSGEAISAEHLADVLDEYQPDEHMPEIGAL